MASTSPDSPSPNADWEQRFGADGYLYGTEPNDFLRRHVDLIPRGRVLCLAEGEGRNAVFLAGQGFEVSSIDLTQAGVAKTHRLAKERAVKVDAVTGDLATADLGVQRWDGIVSIFAHLPAAIRRVVHKRVVDALAPGGVFLLEAYTPEQIGRGTGGPPGPELTMTLSGLLQELEGLELIYALETEREVLEGHGHTGLGSVVEIIARRPA
jgi:SAM-dependent methyltransferase